MEKAEIIKKIEEVLSDVFGEDIEYNETVQASDVDGWDSLNNVRVITSIEEKFDISFNHGDIISQKNLGTIFSTVESKLKG